MWLHYLHDLFQLLTYSVYFGVKHKHLSRNELNFIEWLKPSGT